MGKPSDKRKSARRLGKRERARVKRMRRGECTSYVGGVGTFYVKAGRKKMERFTQWIANLRISRCGNPESSGEAVDGHSTAASHTQFIDVLK